MDALVGVGSCSYRVRINYIELAFMTRLFYELTEALKVLWYLIRDWREK